MKVSLLSLTYTGRAFHDNFKKVLQVFLFSNQAAIFNKLPQTSAFLRK